MHEVLVNRLGGLSLPRKSVVRLTDRPARLAKRREILIFPRTAGNTGNSREILVIPGNYWEIGSSPTRKF